MIPGHTRWDPEVREVQLERLREEAKGAEVGCIFHFQEMATQVKGDSGIFDPTRIEDFDSILRKLRSPTLTEDEFSRTASRMHKEFPAAFKWLGWWLRPSHIGMIFPSMSAVDPAVRAQVPHTSNAVEHIHSLLNQAVGKDNTLMDGIMKIFRFVKKFESDDAAIHGEISTCVWFPSPHSCNHIQLQEGTTPLKAHERSAHQRRSSS